MGHEFVGVVDAVGRDVTEIRPGDRVAVEPNYSCGRCPLCREGNRNLCLSRTAVGIDVDGGFAQAVTVPARCCWPIPEGVGDEQLLLTEPLAVVVRAVNRGSARAGERVAVLGVGTLGLLAVQVLRARGAQVLALGRSTKRFEIARALGAEAVHAIGDGGLEAAARAFSGREGVDLVIEAAGTAEAVGHALELVRPGGRIVLTGLPHAPTTIRAFDLVRRELQLLGSMIYQDEFGEAMQLLAAGRVRTDALVTHRFGLDAIGEAFVAHRDPASIKVAVVP
jgi:2-desacetyl-2-hydroxyethyl bacteriochlorophyllide A dehydrogenase